MVLQLGRAFSSLATARRPVPEFLD
jgi:hypothetical protein